MATSPATDSENSGEGFGLNDVTGALNTYTDVNPANWGQDSLYQESFKTSITGISTNKVLRYPDGLGGATESVKNVPFVVFAPYTRTQTSAGGTTNGAVGGSYFYSSSPETSGTKKDILDRLPPPVFHIVLPLPASALATNYAVTYEQYDLGPYAAMASTGLKAGIAGAAGGALTGAGLAKLFGGNVKQAMAGGAMIGAAAPSAMTNIDYAKNILIKEGLEYLDPAISRAVSSAYLQRTVNPFTENLFKDVQFREHVFTYTFTPRSVDHSKRIDQIIQTFKFFMLPAADAAQGNLQQALLTFPYEFQIYSSVQDTTFAFLPSVLQSVNVSYSGSTGTPVFFRVFREDDNNKRYPAEITVTLNFKEVIILTRQKIGAESKVREADKQVSYNGVPTTYRF